MTRAECLLCPTINKTGYLQRSIYNISSVNYISTLIPGAMDVSLLEIATTPVQKSLSNAQADKRNMLP